MLAGGTPRRSILERDGKHGRRELASWGHTGGHRGTEVHSAAGLPPTPQAARGPSTLGPHLPFQTPFPNSEKRAEEGRGRNPVSTPWMLDWDRHLFIWLLAWSWSSRSQSHTCV